MNQTNTKYENFFRQNILSEWMNKNKAKAKAKIKIVCICMYISKDKLYMSNIENKSCLSQKVWKPHTNTKIPSVLIIHTLN